PKLPLRTRRGIDRGGIVAGEKPRLQLSDPVPALELGQGGVRFQVLLEQKLVKAIIVETAEFRSQAAKASYKRELRPDVILDETETELLRELEVVLGLLLHLDEMIPGSQHVLNHVIAAEARVRNVTAFVRDIKGAADKIAARADVRC